MIALYKKQINYVIENESHVLFIIKWNYLELELGPN